MPRWIQWSWGGGFQSNTPIQMTATAGAWEEINFTSLTKHDALLRQGAFTLPNVTMPRAPSDTDFWTVFVVAAVRKTGDTAEFRLYDVTNSTSMGSVTLQGYDWLVHPITPSGFGLTVNISADATWQMQYKTASSDLWFYGWTVVCQSWQ